MERAQNHSALHFPSREPANPVRAQKQLIREIACLERQLERLRLRRDLLNPTTLITYQNMIVTRQALLDAMVVDG